MPRSCASLAANFQLASRLQSGMTFNENNVNRDQGGKFDHKIGEAANVSLTNAPSFEDTLSDRLGEDVTVREYNGVHYIESGDELLGTYDYTYGGTQLEVFSETADKVKYGSSLYRAVEDAERVRNGLPQFKNERERNDKHIEDEVNRAIADGIFQKGRLMNGSEEAGDWSYHTDLTRLATGPNGERLSAGFSIEKVSKPGKDQDGNDVAVRYDISLSGDVRSKTGAWEGGGQVGDYFYGAEPFKGTKTDPTELAGLWEKNHLNSMHAGTAEQEAWAKRREEELGRKLTTDERLKDIPTDSQTGYKYGSAWLYKDVPADDIADMLRNFRSAKK